MDDRDKLDPPPPAGQKKSEHAPESEGGPLPQKTEREQLVSNEVARLESMLGDLDRDWGYIRWSAGLLPLGGVAYMVYGLFAFSVWVVLVVCFLVTSAYLIGVRRKEYESEIELLKRSFLRGPKSA